ncbi:DNA polymerase domain-containing protein [Desulfofundulus thermobenzoicus]|uniref:DNA polymerase domain-containing protein n=1 Tax=Desulfofundulus thermobenzoicus TaxID=29376 RepID=A0A6N7IMT1_9FIRM|nr:non-homologous end-joining DNA ligase [Desulfofundulus thermobenzoicus]MQL51261.1 DNA polymerase domain-containing protein [Desulfofundulus thermobenzoicus]HHW44362.1 DNA polymerase domain-containing protein [Desulfotomaculum sp.]
MSSRPVSVANRTIVLTNLEKIFWPGGLTKAHLIKYYTDIAPVLLPHIYNRPLVMKRYPDGINGESFYQKECPDYAPDWIETFPVRHSRKVINYVVCNDLATLLWLANLGCIEVHSWLSTVDHIDCPDMAVMDLDPAEGATFQDVLQVALLVRRALAAFDLRSWVKTSGASGVHLFIPIQPEYSFQEVTRAMKYIALLVQRAHPGRTTLERAISKRKGKVYLDYLQNGRGKTMVFPYSLRPLPGATLSAPLLWKEVETLDVDPVRFNINTIFKRMEEYGDLFSDLLVLKQSMGGLMDAMLKDEPVVYSHGREAGAGSDVVF